MRLDRYALKSYSQEGEDMILRRIFENLKTGFYVDVGAHHPARFSNTNYFYKRGWRGLNIDAMPGSMAKFKKYRVRDISIEAAISANEKEMVYYIFNEPALNGFSEKMSLERDANSSKFRIKRKVQIKTRRLESILDEVLPAGQHIDFMSIDVEGLDFDVLKSNNWNKYKPDVILVEVLGQSIESLVDSNITRYLNNIGYYMFSKAVQTVIYKQRGSAY